MKDLKQRREQNEQQDQEYQDINEVNRDYMDDLSDKAETSFGGTEEEQPPDHGRLDEFFTIREERKAYYFKKFFGFPLQRDIDPELFLKTDSVSEKTQTALQK